MKQKYINLVLFIVFIITALVAKIILNNIAERKVETLKEHQFLTTATEMQQQFNTLVKEKQKATLAIALLLSKNGYFKTALLNNKVENINLEEYSGILKQHSDFKNIWFQLVNKQGISIARSWTKKRGDSVLDIRPDIVEILKYPKIKTPINVGKFDLTFKAIVPIYNNKQTIGIFEAITHFNSITKNLRKKHTCSVIIVDKKYKKQLIKPFSKIFIDDYYIANKNAKQKDLDIIKRKGVEFFKNYNKVYYFDKVSNELITIVKMYDVNNQPMSYAVLFKSLDHIDMSKIVQIKTNEIFYILMIIMFIGLVLYYISSKKYNQNIKNEHQRTKLILNTQPDIIMLTNGKIIIDANSELLKFFNQYTTLDEFISDHKCICDFFEKIDDNDYISSDVIDGIPWISYIINQTDRIIKVAMKKDDKLHHFIIKASQSDISKNNDELFIVIVLIDITHEIQTSIELAQKEKLLAEQSKMAAMGEMIGNIAHQWRQPLSAITASATGIQMQSEYGILTDEVLDKSCENINTNAQYLSKTIDDFRNFIKGDRVKHQFDLKDNIESFIQLIEGSAKNNNIDIQLSLSDNIIIDGYDNELMQCFINIFNNAKDALKDRNIEHKLLFINTYSEDNMAVIEIKDNAQGISKDVLPKIFDPYFTTKHQSRGTGLGLNMTYKLIVEGMQGSIEAHNIEYDYESYNYKGAIFTIKLPMS